MLPGAKKCLGAAHTLLARIESSYFPLLNVTVLRWVFLSIAVGLLSGMAASAYYALVEFGQHYLQVHLAGVASAVASGEGLFSGAPTGYRPWLLPLFTVLTALATGLLVKHLCPESEEGGTDGTDSMIKAFHSQAGKVSLKVTLVKGLTSILTLASGGSAGREGPISLIGGGLASFFSTRLGLSEKERRILLLAGMAGGLGAIFRAPLGGALTAVEVLYAEDFEAEAILPAIISSVVAYSVFNLIYGATPIFSIPAYKLGSPLELVFYAALALICAGAARLHVASFFFIKRRLLGGLKRKIGYLGTIVTGGLGVGLLIMIFPDLMSGGYGVLEQALRGELPLVLMAALILGKSIATSLTIGSGMSGGMFAPSLFIGGMCGGVVGRAAGLVFPGSGPQVGAYGLVGMVAFFAALANASFGPLIMVCEITQSYSLLVPLMLATALSIICSKKFSIYENQAASKFNSPAHYHELTINTLKELQVRDHFSRVEVPVVRENDPVGTLAGLFAHNEARCLPVADANGRITGAVQLRDARFVMYEKRLAGTLVVKDVARQFICVSPKDDLYSDLIRFIDSGLSELPVLDDDEAHSILGLLDMEDIFRAYKRAMDCATEG